MAPGVMSETSHGMTALPLHIACHRHLLNRHFFAGVGIWVSSIFNILSILVNILAILQVPAGQLRSTGGHATSRAASRPADGQLRLLR